MNKFILHRSERKLSYLFESIELYWFLFRWLENIVKIRKLVVQSTDLNIQMVEFESKELLEMLEINTIWNNVTNKPSNNTWLFYYFSETMENKFSINFSRSEESSPWQRQKNMRQPAFVFSNLFVLSISSRTFHKNFAN